MDDRPCQDEPGREAGKLSRWFASRPNARQDVREATGVSSPPSTPSLKIVRGIRYERAQGATFAEMQANASTEIRNAGDAVLCWVNEGDLCHAGLAAAALSTGAQEKS